jgi:hypothetical protein
LGKRGWEKTAHTGAHRVLESAAVRSSAAPSPTPERVLVLAAAEPT